MSAKDCLRYCFGHADAIRTVATSRAALPTGVLLVLLTSIARNYDQTFVGEHPWKWCLGSLVFSLISGSWIYFAAYRGLAGRFSRPAAIPMASSKSPSAWPTFMGLFWMTAPIAWLYAIPVERFTSSLASAQFNAALLVVVSVWRVLLMARVLAVLCGVSMRKSLVWVLVPALIEVLAVFLGGVGEIIGRSMGGMQLSPEKEFILKAQSQVFGCVIWALPVVLIWAYWDRAKLPIQALPISRRVEPLPWRFLLGTALFWLAVAVYPQMEQSRNAHLEKLIEEQHWREALDFMADQGKESFAPSRPLPPPNYGSQANKQTPPLLDAATAKDPAWLRLHLAQRGGSWALNLTPGFRVFNKTNDFKENMEILVYRFSRYNDSAKAFSQWLNGMQRLPEGRDWLSSHPIVLRALANAVQEALQQESPLSLTRQERESWQSLEKALRDQGIAPDLPDLNPSVNPSEEP